MNIQLIRDKLLGEKLVFQRKLDKIYPYSNENCLPEKFQNRNKGLYLLVLIILFLSTILFIDEMFSETNIVKDSKGNIVAIERENDGQGQNLTFNVVFYEEGRKYSKEVVLTVLPENYLDKKDKSVYDSKGNSLEGQILQLSKKLSTDKEGNRLILPNKLVSGKKIIWEEEKEYDGLYLFLVGIFLFIYFYKERWSQIKKLEAEASESIDKSLPEFLSRIVLLMEAGCVFTIAFERTVKNRYEKGNDEYFYNQLYMMKKLVESQKRNFYEEFESFAVSSKNRQFIRIIGIVADNAQKGTKLVEKLKRESQLLWAERKRSLEKRGALLETKSLVPMSMMLIVLVIITVAPALMTM